MDWIAKTAIAAFVFCFSALVGLEIYGNQISYKNQIKAGASDQNTYDQRHPFSEALRPHDAPITGVVNHEPPNHNGNPKMNQDPWIWFGDGLAQWLMTLLAAVGVGVSAYAVHLLKRTLAQGNAINEATVTAARAANEANTIMREEQRPWVVLHVEPRCEFTDCMKEGKIDFTYKLENIGKLPARSIFVNTALIKDDRNEPTQADIELFIERCKLQAHGFVSPILFGGETNGRLRVAGRLTYRGWEGRFPKPEYQGVMFTLMICTTYFVDRNDPPTIGYEFRAFTVVNMDAIEEGRQELFELQSQRRDT